MADLLGELASGNRQQIPIGVIRFALRNRPVALVPAREERPAWVTEQDLRLAGRHRTAKEDDPSALPAQPSKHRRAAPLPFGIHPS